MKPTRTSLLPLLLLAACSVDEAKMRLPVGLEPQTTRVELTGMGGWQSGTFRLGSSTGSFTRRAERLGIFDPLFVKRYGGSSFSVSGPEFAGELSASCGFRQKDVAVGNISVTPQRLSYSCRFRRNGRPAAAEFELGDRNGFLGSLDGRKARVGHVDFDGLRLDVRSIHLAEGSPIPLAAPLGYVLELDGRSVGAVDLNGTDKTIFVPADPKLREAALAAALALSVLWDPAEVDPGR